MESFKNLHSFSLTTDGWTSQGYIAHTVHHVNKTWDLCSHLLDITELPKEHTAANLASDMEECLDYWNLPVTKLAAVMSDNASNIVLAINMLQWQHFGCFAHTLQLGVRKALDIPQLSRAIGRAKRLVTFFLS